MTTHPPRIWWLTAVVVGAALVLLAATLTVDVSGIGLPPDNGPPVFLTEGAVVAWVFPAERPGLSGFRLWLDQPTVAEAELVAKVSHADLPAITLVETVVPLVAVEAHQTVDLRFVPLWMMESPPALTTTLRVQLEVRMAGSQAKIGLKSGCGPAGEGRTPAFLPRYQVRIFDLILPISRIAAGRPGLVGWPPLYALLAYGFIVLLLRTVLLVWQAGTGGSERNP